MSVILTKYKGESTTFGFVIPDSYDLANMQDVKVYVGSKVYSHVMDNVRTVKAKLTSEDTQTLQGRNSVIFHIDDAVFGIRKILVGEFQVDNTTDNFRDESVNLGYDVLVMLKVEIDTIEVDSILYNIAKGDSAFTAWQKLPENVGKDWNDYIAYLREPMTQAIAEGNETAAEWTLAENARVQAEGLRITAEGLRVTAEGLRNDSEILRASSENTRNSNESTRNNNESTRNSNENIRISNALDANNAEALRLSAELLRISAESGRVSAETARVNKETLRVTAENNRVSAEALRVTAESNRVSAENLRVSAENIRISNEAARVASGAELKTNMSTNIEADKSSTTKYPQLKALYDWATGRFLTMTQTVSQTIGATGARLLKLWTTDIESTNMPTVGGVSLSTTFAAKTQEAWITPTLLNGATFNETDPLKYRLNQNRRVEFKGKINVITSGAQAFILPAGYRSSISSSRKMQLANGNVPGLATIQSGYVYTEIGTVDFFGATFTID